MKDITKKYSNGEITVVWKPAVCIHSTECFQGLPKVFNPNQRPWINADAATTEQIIHQVNKCPSGALSYYRNDGKAIEPEAEETIVTKVEVMPNGPLLVYGELIITDAQGQAITKNKVTAFCRCGHSGKKPFCDGSHSKIGFEG